MLVAGQHVEVVLAKPLRRNARESIYSVSGEYGGVAEDSGIRFVTILGDHHHVASVPVSNIGLLYVGNDAR